MEQRANFGVDLVAIGVICSNRVQRPRGWSEGDILRPVVGDDDECSRRGSGNVWRGQRPGNVVLVVEEEAGGRWQVQQEASVRWEWLVSVQCDVWRLDIKAYQ
ncbi:hypothetical protein BHM03_00061105 [Ensete ventricosum]|nr:hypothetical protein BHM03_00061105 [Ensete ventricosum]